MDSMEVMSVADRLKYIRESRGCTYAEVGSAVGVTAQAIYRYETGDSTPSLIVMQKLAQFYEMDPKKLFF